MTSVASARSDLKQGFSSRPETEAGQWQGARRILATRPQGPVASDEALACRLCGSEFPHRDGQR